MWCLSNNILKVVSPFLAFVLQVLSIFLDIFLSVLLGRYQQISHYSRQEFTLSSPHHRLLNRGAKASGKTPTNFLCRLISSEATEPQGALKSLGTGHCVESKLESFSHQFFRYQPKRGSCLPFSTIQTLILQIHQAR